jgi:hypothetical protein
MNTTLSIDAARIHDSQSSNFKTTKSLDPSFIDERLLKLSSLPTPQEGVERRLETEYTTYLTWWDGLSWVALVIIYVMFAIALHPGGHAPP